MGNFNQDWYEALPGVYLHSSDRSNESEVLQRLFPPEQFPKVISGSIPKPYYIEIVLERFCGHVLRSLVREATEAEVQDAMEKYKAGKCEHALVQDDKGWMYDVRSCALCGEGLGTV